MVIGNRKIKNSFLEIMFRAIKLVFRFRRCLASVQVGVPVWMLLFFQPDVNYMLTFFLMARSSLLQIVHTGY